MENQQHPFVLNIFDTDLYKFTTSYAYMKLYPDAEGTFRFTDRNNTSYTPEQYETIREAINKLKELPAADIIPMIWLEAFIPFIPAYYWEWLTHSFRFDPDKVIVLYDEVSGHLDINVTDKMYKVTLYEIPILCIVAAVQGINNPELNIDYYILQTLKKTSFAEKENIMFSEFGTRRRYSAEVQATVCDICSRCKTCTGTSNVYFAYKYGMTPMGTHPHEWFMFHGAQFGYQHANYLALEAWMQVYNGNLGIALTDTYTSDVFFKNFSMLHANALKGVRQDSGDEYEFIDKACQRYMEHNIDPQTKTIVFSNGLNMKKAAQINKACEGRIIARFGIGTNLTNDTPYKAPNIVMKLTSCKMTKRDDDRECIKISDDLGKHMGSQKEIEYAFHALGIKQ